MRAFGKGNTLGSIVEYMRTHGRPKFSRATAYAKNVQYGFDPKNRLSRTDWRYYKPVEYYAFLACLLEHYGLTVPLDIRRHITPTVAKRISEAKTHYVLYHDEIYNAKST